MLINFTKFSGTGNDFIIIDSSEQEIPNKLSELARFACRKHLGIGADGLVVISNLSQGKFIINCLNPDGSVATMCGNALRCCASFIFKKFQLSNPYLEISGSLIESHVDKDFVSISFPQPHGFQGPVKLENREVYIINTGTEHGVVFVDSLNDVDVTGEGSKLRYHQFFSPIGLNVNFVQVDNTSTIKVRTYERGVEAETLSCGSGAVASALISRHIQKIFSPIVTVINSSENPLKIKCEGDNLPFNKIWLSGPVCEVYKGEFEWNL
jgi:diaminopimelate epimerase